MTLNVDLLTRTLAHIRSFPQGWDQEDWRRLPGLYAGTPITIDTPCGTSMCLAGEAIQLVDPEAWIVTSADIAKAKAAGDTRLMKWQAGNLSAVKGDRMALEFTYTTYAYDHTATRMVFASSYATQLLGLTEHQANVLFASPNNLDDLHHLADIAIAGGDVDDYFALGDTTEFNGPLFTELTAQRFAALTPQ